MACASAPPLRVVGLCAQCEKPRGERPRGRWAQTPQTATFPRRRPAKPATLAAKKQQNGERLRKSRTGCANGWVATDACGFRPAPPLSVDMLRSAAAQVTALVSLDVFEAVTHAAGRRR